MNGLRLAFRTLRKTPFVTGVAVLSLALGIGANAAIFSLFDQLLLQALPVHEPERLVNFENPGPIPGSNSCNDAGGCDEVFSYLMFRDLEAVDGPFEGVAAHRMVGANLATSGRTTSGQAMAVSGSYFPLLGLTPALGRLLGPDDDRDIGAHFVAVLSHAYWQDELGGDPGVLNRSIVINGNSMTIVGVAPRGFGGTTLGLRADVFVPLTMRGQLSAFWNRFDNRRSYWAYLFARLKPGVPMETAQEEINTTYAAIINEVEAPLQGGMSEQTMERFRAKELILTDGVLGQSSMHEDVETPLRLLLAITGVVLLIACANIANLLLARGAGRAREMAVRGSLGAGRAVLIRQLLTESLLLALIGGAASLVVAYWTLGLITGILPPETAGHLGLRLEPSIIVFAGALSIGTGFLFGLYPALHATRMDLVTMLKAGGGQPSAARAAARFRTTLVTAQIALSMTLLVTAGLFIRSLTNVSRVDLGIESQNVITFGLSPELNGYGPDETRALFIRTEEEIAAIPGVGGVSAAMVPLLAGDSWGTDVSVQGFEGGPDIDSNSRLNQVAPGHFANVGVPLLAGREFTDSDVVGAPQVAIVNEEFTRKFGLDGADAVGKFMSDNGSRARELDIEIVGVVQDASYADVKRTVPPLFFTPYRQNEQLGEITFYVRTALEPEQIFPLIPQTIAALDPNLPVEDLKLLEQQISENVYLDRLISALAAAFATLATLLAAVGLYGVLAYAVAQRTREIGVRMALGARAVNVRVMVLGQVGRMAVAGGLVGIVAAIGLGRFMESLLFGMEARDPAVMVVVAAVLAAVVFLAGYLPARRASRVDPNWALRYE